MPKFKLTAQHYLHDAAGNAVLVEEGTVVGDGCAIPFKGRPSLNMEGADDAGKKAVEDRLKNALRPIESLPMTLNGGVN